MLSYESKPILPPEPTWRAVVSIMFGSVACAAGLLMWWQTVPGLWELATFTPSGPIRPMGYCAALFLLMLGGTITGFVLGKPAESLSKRRAARIVASIGVISCLLPAVNFLLFFVIVFVRRIQLGD